MLLGEGSDIDRVVKYLFSYDDPNLAFLWQNLAMGKIYICVACKF